MLWVSVGEDEKRLAWLTYESRYRFLEDDARLMVGRTAKDWQLALLDGKKTELP